MPNRHRQHSASFFAKERILQHSCSLISRVHCKMILKTPQDYLLRIKEEFWGQFINFQDPFKKKLKYKDFLLFCNYYLLQCITFFYLHVLRKKIFNLEMIHPFGDIFKQAVLQHWWLFYCHQIFQISRQNFINQEPSRY